jgi:hypothetical protein
MGVPPRWDGGQINGLDGMPLVPTSGIVFNLPR